MVQKRIEETVYNGTWLEISYLVPPQLIDNVGWHRKTAKWLSSLSPDIPVHILYFYPFHKMKESYDWRKLLKVYEIMSEHLNYVYIPNLYEEEAKKYQNTKCRICGKILIERPDINEIRNECCQVKVPGIWK